MTTTCLHPQTFRVDSQGVTEFDTPGSSTPGSLKMSAWSNWRPSASGEESNRQQATPGFTQRLWKLACAWAAKLAEAAKSLWVKLEPDLQERWGEMKPLLRDFEMDLFRMLLARVKRAAAPLSTRVTAPS